MTSRFALLAALVLLSACGGRTPPPPWMVSPDKPRDENYHGGNAAVLLMRYDANHDGILTKEELEAGLRAEFAAHDTLHNGCLDSDQVAQINQARVDADQSTATPIMDWNQDANHDGKLTPKEMGKRPMPADADQPQTDQPPKGDQRGGPPGGGEPPSGPPPRQ